MREDNLATRIRSEAAIADRPGQMERLEQIAAEVERLQRGARELGKSLVFWLDLAVKATGSEDCIEDDGDGDYDVVAERLAAMAPEATS
jgi:hypothetical protein